MTHITVSDLNPNVFKSAKNCATLAKIAPGSVPRTREEIAMPTKEDVKNERELQSLAELELHRKDIAYLHLSPKAREKKGWPDLTFCFWRNYVLFPCAVELKSAGGKLSKDQVDCLSRMKRNGWRVYVIRSLVTFVDLLNSNPVEEWHEETTDRE